MHAVIKLYPIPSCLKYKLLVANDVNLHHCDEPVLVYNLDQLHRRLIG